MITSGEVQVYDAVAGCDVLLYYDVLVVRDRSQVFIYDRLCRYIGAHEFSRLSFDKAPDYWVARIGEQLLAGRPCPDGWTPSPNSPLFAREREIGELGREPEDGLEGGGAAIA